MNIFQFLKRARYMKPAEEGDGGAGAAADRGDDFVPTAEDIAKAAAEGTATPEELEAERAKLGLKAAAPAAEPAKEPAKEGEAATIAKTPEEVEADAAAAAAGKPKDTRIPLARHTEILARERAAREAAELEVSKLRQGQEVAKTNEQLTAMETKIVELEAKYTEQIAEGDTKAAQATMTQIRQSERQVIQQRAAFETQVATAQAIEQVRYDATVERLEAAFPQIKPGTDEFDKAIVAEVLEMSEAFQGKGYTPSVALQKACGYVIKPTTAKQTDAVVVEPRVTAAAAEAAKLERETAARKTAAAAANAQPPATSKVGANADEAGGKLDAKSVIKMSYDTFSKLTEEDLSRARGDIV